MYGKEATLSWYCLDVSATSVGALQTGKGAMDGDGRSWGIQEAEGELLVYLDAGDTFEDGTCRACCCCGSCIPVLSDTSCFRYGVAIFLCRTEERL